MIRGIIFDMDGVLVDSKEMWVGVVHRTLQEAGIGINVEKVRQLIVPSVPLTIERLVPHDTPGRDQVVRSSIIRARQLCIQATAAQSRPVDGVAEALAALRSRGMRIFLVTNGVSAYVQKVLTVFSLSGFERVISSDNGFANKEAAIADISAKTRIRLEEVAYVGDVAMDVEVARRSGCKSIIAWTRTSWEWPDRSKIDAAKPDTIVSSLAELVKVI